MFLESSGTFIVFDTLTGQTRIVINRMATDTIEFFIVILLRWLKQIVILLYFFLLTTPLLRPLLMQLHWLNPATFVNDLL